MTVEPRPGSGTPEPTPNGQAGEIGPCQTWDHQSKGRIHGVEVRGDETWMHVRLVGDHRMRWFSPGRARSGEVTPDGEVVTLRRSFMTLVPDDVPVPPAPSSDTPSDERGDFATTSAGRKTHQVSWNVGHMSDPYAEAAARPAPSPVPEASGRGEVVQPTMHILRRADGEEMGEFAFWATDGPDGWDMAEDTDHDEDTVYEILACYPVARRKILWSTLCETCDGEGDGCPACAGSGECEPPDAEHMPIIARPAPSSSPVGDRVPPVHLLLDIWQALGGDSEAFHPWWAADPSFPDRWAQIVAAVAGNFSDLAADSNPPVGALLDIAIQFGAADRGERTNA